MNKRVIISLFAVMALFVIGGCSVTQEIVKSGDPARIYDHALSLYEEENWNKAATLFESMEPYFQGTSREDSLLFYKARCKYKISDYETAAPLLDDFRRRFGRSPFLEDAEGMYTLCYYYMTSPSTRDQSSSKVAIIVVDEYMARYPDSEHYETFVGLKDDLVFRLHEKAYLNAYTYYKIGRYKSAIIAFRGALKEYPESKLREKISYYIVASAYELASNSVLSKKEDRFLQMIDSYISFIAEFPDSEYRDDVELKRKRAEIYLERQETIRERAKLVEAGEIVESDAEARERLRDEQQLNREETRRAKRELREGMNEEEKKSRKAE